MQLGRCVQVNLQRVRFPSEFNRTRVEGMNLVVRMHLHLPELLRPEASSGLSLSVHETSYASRSD